MRDAKVTIVWRQEPPTPAQTAAWKNLWTRLFGPETRQPQDPRPGAGNDATMTNDSHIPREYPNDTTHRPRRT